MWIFLLTLAGLVLAGVLYQCAATILDARRYPPPGQLVEVEGCRLHLDSAGEGGPAVVLEAGLGASSLSWCLVQPVVAQFTRVCSYDRPGAGWSDPLAEIPTAERTVERLRALLRAAGVPPPYILAGHSAGSLTVRLFARKYPREVAGLVLVDPIRPEDYVNPDEARRRRMAGGIKLCRRGSWYVRLGWVRLLLRLILAARAPWISELALFLGSGRAVSGGNRIVSALQQLPPGVPAVLRAHWSRPRFFQSLARQIAALPESARQVAEAGSSLEDIPLVVLSAGRDGSTHNEVYERMAGLSLRGRHVVAGKSDHFILLDEPGLIAEAIREVVRLHRGELSEKSRPGQKL